MEQASSIAEAKAEEVLEDKADVDGSYETLHAGTASKATLADNFDSKMVLTDNSGYLYRTTGGSLEVGEQNRVKKIVGASVPIIQLIDYDAYSTSTDNGITYTKNNDGSWTLNGTATAMSTKEIFATHGVVLTGHKYLMRFTKSSNTGIVMYYSASTETFTCNGEAIASLNTSSSERIRFVVYEGTTLNNVRVYPIFVDLTATFGTTVANRLYALEQAQAGSGIAKAKEILVKDYYPYNVTAFTHTKTSGKVNNGFNQWDEQWELGTYSTQTGEKVSGNSNIRSKNMYECFPNTTYYLFNKALSGGFRFLEYDGEGNFIQSTSKGNGTITTTANTKYFAFFMASNYGTTYNNNICINLHWDGERDGEYEPYQEWNYPVQDIELKGILSLDAQNNWVADGDEYLPSGVLTGNFALVDMGDLNYTYFEGTDGHHYFQTAVTRKNAYGNFNIRCPKYATNTQTHSTGATMPDLAVANDKMIFVNSGSSNFYISDSSYESAEAFKTAVTGIYLLYQPVTSTESTADSYTELQNDSNWGTEKWIDTRDVPMPVFSTCEYIPDLKAKVETAPESPTEDGDYIMHRENGQNSYTSLPTWLGDNGYHKLNALSGYDATKTQTLKNVEGTFTWVDD